MTQKKWKKLTVLASAFIKSCLLILLVAPMAFAAPDGTAEQLLSTFTPPADWVRQEPSQYSSAPFYILKKNEVVETIALSELSDPSAAKAPTSDSLLKKKLEEHINEDTATVGIRDWNIKTLERTLLAPGTLIKLRGSYIGVAGKRIYFEEWKYYIPEQGLAQVTFTIEGVRHPADPEYIHSLLKRFAPFGVKL